MYFITKEKDLVGKTIAFIHCAQFAEEITLATTDGGILMVQQTGGVEESEIQVFHEHQAEFRLFVSGRNEWLVDELKKIGVIGKDEYQKRCEARKLKIEQEEKKREEYREQHERDEYFRLKAKFEGVL